MDNYVVTGECVGIIMSSRERAGDNYYVRTGEGGWIIIMSSREKVGG